MRKSQGNGLLLIAGALLILLGGVALYGRTAIIDREAFATRATTAFAQDEVQDEVADRIARGEVDANPALTPLRPTLDAAVAEVVHDWRFPASFNAGALAMHDDLFGGRSVRLAIPRSGADVKAALPAGSYARSLLAADDPQLFQLGGGRLETGLVNAAPWARRLASLWPIALLAGLALLVAAALRAPERRRGLRSAALAAAFAGGAVVMATTSARAIVLSTFDTSHGDAVVREIWDAFIGDLRLWGLAVGALGLVVAAACEPGARGAWRRIGAQIASPCGAAARIARAGALLVLAGLLLWMPEVPLDLALVSAAGVLVFTAAAELVRVSSAR